MFVLLLVAFLTPAETAVAGSPSIAFHGERIVLTVLEGRIRVCGEYRFRNDGPEEAGERLFYPFPVDSMHPAPDTTSIETGGEAVPFRVGARGVAFTAEVPAASMRTYRICYEQECSVPAGCYILTTTAAWPEPLAEAEFEVIVPGGFALTRLSYEPDETEHRDGGTVYRFRRTRFLPDRDLCVEWRRRVE
ncbi:MAG: hypothetical protein ABIK65_04325 [Candidatus Eisenbacteria bacterium]